VLPLHLRQGLSGASRYVNRLWLTPITPEKIMLNHETTAGSENVYPQFMLKSVNTVVVSAIFVCGNYPYTSEIPQNGVEHLTGPEFHKHCYQPIWCIVNILVLMRYPSTHKLWHIRRMASTTRATDLNDCQNLRSHQSLQEAFTTGVSDPSSSFRSCCCLELCVPPPGPARFVHDLWWTYRTLDKLIADRFYCVR
jgi:hypothetical protein